MIRSGDVNKDNVHTKDKINIRKVEENRSDESLDGKRIHTFVMYEKTENRFSFCATGAITAALVLCSQSNLEFQRRYDNFYV